jgi:alpha-L-rhamnosidase
MFGTVTEWYYRWLAGIRPDPENPGFEVFVLAPSTPAGLDAVSCTYASPLGPIVSNWEKQTDGAYQYEMTIPEESTAMVKLPLKATDEIRISGPADAESIEGLQSGQFELSAGMYSITVAPTSDE